MPKRLLITGLNGFVAGSAVMQAPNNWEVHGIARTAIPQLPDRITPYYFNLLEKEPLQTLFARIKPDIVIHTAAIASIDQCQLEPELAGKINIEITINIADLCKTYNSKLVFCSTDSVFNGLDGDYNESDLPDPINVYAETKISAEKIVIKSASRNVVARLALVMGVPVIGKGNSFLADMIQKMSNNEPVKFPSNEIRTPIDVITLGAALNELADNDFGGYIHLSGNTCLNRYQMGLYIADRLGFNREMILATNSNAMQGRAPRAENVSMDNTLAKRILKTPMRSLEDGLELTLNFKTPYK